MNRAKNWTNIQVSARREHAKKTIRKTRACKYDVNNVKKSVREETRVRHEIDAQLSAMDKFFKRGSGEYGRI